MVRACRFGRVTGEGGAAFAITTVMTGERHVQCFHCLAVFPVAARASVLTCPSCYRRVRVEDIVVEREEVGSKFETCGRVIIRRKGRMVASTVVASLGVEVMGELEADAVVSSRIFIGSRARWRGHCQAGVIIVEPGATIRSGRFQIQLQPLETNASG